MCKNRYPMTNGWFQRGALTVFALVAAGGCGAESEGGAGAGGAAGFGSEAEDVSGQQTRTIASMSEADLIAVSGVAVYEYEADNQTVTLLDTYVPTSTAGAWYEVSVIAVAGSWWLATLPGGELPGEWTKSGAEVLSATGDIATAVEGETIMRPTSILWWVPADAAATLPFSATTVAGTVVGTFPSLEP